MTTATASIGIAAYSIDATGSRTVQLAPAPRVLAASVLKPLLAWAAASVGPLAQDGQRWASLAQAAVTISDNEAAGLLWSQSGGELLLEALNDQLGTAWRVDGTGEHASLRIPVTAAELARGYAALAADRGHASTRIRQWMRDVPAEQTFGVRPTAQEVLGVDAGEVGVKCGWFGGERAHAVVVVAMGDRTVGAAVTTSGSPDPATVAAVRDAAGNDARLAAAHDRLRGEEIRQALRRALVAAGEL